MSYASNLKKGASVDIVVPDHLKITARKLEHKAYKLRQMSKTNAAGDDDKIIKTQVRFDNVRENLVLSEAPGTLHGNFSPTGPSLTDSDDDMEDTDDE